MNTRRRIREQKLIDAKIDAEQLLTPRRYGHRDEDYRKRAPEAVRALVLLVQ